MAFELAPAVPPPPALAPLVAQMETAAGQPLELVRAYEGESARLLRGVDVVGYLASDEPGRTRLRSERRRSTWLAAHDVPVPELVAAAPDDAWLLFRRHRSDAPEGEACVRCASELCARLESLPLPALAEQTPARSRKPRLSENLRYAARGVIAASRGSLPLGRFAASRLTEHRRVRALPTVLAHGDLNPNNLLWDAVRSSLVLIDFEHLGAHPRGADVAALWCGLRRRDDRQLLLELSPASAEAAQLLPTMALRTLGDITAGTPRQDWEPERIRQALEVLDEATSAARRPASLRP